MKSSLFIDVVCLLAGVALIILLTTRFRVHAFFALLLSCAVVGLGVGLSPDSVIGIAKDGFGNIMRSLGFIIVLGTTLGVLLEHTGATRVMAEYILRRTGERRSPLAMSITGFIVGLPIFCDSGFIVLSGLNKSLARRSHTPLVIMSVSLATGLYSVHCLIPPHPGAAAAAGTLGVDLSRLIPYGIIVAIPAAIAGYAWARFAGRNEPPPREEDEPVDIPENEGPSVVNAFLPVVVPIALIGLRSFLSIGDTHPSPTLSFFLVLGDPVAALFIGILLAFAGGRDWRRHHLGSLLNDAVEKAGSVLVIIGAGGAFGAILAATKMGDQLSASLPLARLGIFFPFLLTAVLKTAQGSSTVAIITASSIVKPLLPALGLATGNGPLLCVLSMGAGSMLLSHANDAYFWVVTRLSGLGLKAMLRTYSPATALMGLIAYAAVYILSRLIG
ncbi:MAG: GntP family permease [Bacteroidetes bacterium]|nr:GntP family permease [Bacteroidota bacterium]